MFVGSRVFFVTFDPRAWIRTQLFGSGRNKEPSMELEAASEAEGVHGGRDVTSEGPAVVLETHAVALDATAAAEGTIALTQEQKKLLEVQ